MSQTAAINQSELIKPVHDTDGGAFAEQILADLLEQGYMGNELLEKFKTQNRAVRPAVLKLIQEADSFAETGKGRIAMDELFGMEG